jgi:predicted CoA-binding protein
MSATSQGPAADRPVPDIVADYLKHGPNAVVGASNDRTKFGNRVLRAYVHHGWKVYPVNPRETVVEGLPAYPNLGSLPEKPRGVSIITPPAITERIVAEAADAGARFVWMQPGAESPEAIRIARDRGLEVIADGTCFLVETRFRG